MNIKDINNQTIIQLLEQNKEMLKKYKVKKIGLFGSYARDQQNAYSDIDLLVEFDLNQFQQNFKGLYDAFIELSQHLEDIFEVKVDLIPNDSISPYIKPYVEKDIQWYETEPSISQTHIR